MEYKELKKVEEKLDKVLQYVVNLPANDLFDRVQIANGVNANGYLKEITEILLKLYKDGYLHTQNDMGVGYFTSNFDGRIFIDHGGYTAKSLADASNAEEQRLEIARLRSFDAANNLNQTTLNTLTGRLVVATWFAFGAAILLFLWQVWIWNYPTKKDFAHKNDIEKSTPKKP